MPIVRLNPSQFDFEWSTSDYGTGKPYEFGGISYYK